MLEVTVTGWVEPSNTRPMKRRLSWSTFGGRHSDETGPEPAPRLTQPLKNGGRGVEAVELRAERDETCHPDFGHARFQGRSAARGPNLWVMGHGLQTLVIPPALMRAQAVLQVADRHGTCRRCPEDLRLLITTQPTRPLRPLLKSPTSHFPLPLPLSCREGTTTH